MSVRFAFATFMLATAGGLAAPLTITFNSSLLASRPGMTVTFSATLVNTTGANVFLNGDSVNVQAPLTVNDTKFFLNTPVFLAGGQSFTGQLFDVTLPGATPLGLYSGNFSILGGSTANTLETVGSAPFAVNAVPEPGTSLLLGGGLLMLALGFRSRALSRRRAF